jgi:hypothetical protein
MEAALNGPHGRIALGSASLTLGRAQDNSLVVSDAQSSGHHAEIAPGPQGTNHVLIDLGSTNGTFVNEERLTPRIPRPLRASDVIRIGETRFTFEVAGSAEATVRGSLPASDPDATVLGGPTPFPLSDDTSFDFPRPPEYAQPSTSTPPAPGYPEQPQPGEFAQPAYSQQPQLSTSGYPQQGGYPEAGGFAPQAQAPGYPGPGGFAPQPGPGGPPVAPAKKSRALLWLGLVVVIALVAGGAFAAWLSTRSTPQKTLDAACAAIKSGDSQAFYDLFSQPVKAKTKSDDIKQLFAGFTLLGGVKSCSYSDVQQGAGKASALLQVEFSGNSTEAQTASKPGKIDLVNENDTWKLDANTSAGGTTI